MALRVDFYDPVPVKGADSAAGTPAVFSKLSDDRANEDRENLYNSLLTHVRAKMLSPSFVGDTGVDGVRTPRPSCWELELQFVDPSDAIADQLSYVLGEGVPLQVRIGYQEQDPSTDLVIPAVVVAREFMVKSSEGLVINVRAVAASVDELLRRGRKQIAVYKNTTVPRFFADMAAEYGWSTSRAVVQPGGVFTRDIPYDQTVDVLRFIRDRVIPAIDVSGADHGTGEPYQLFFESDGTVHLHQPAWSQNPNRNLATDRKIVLRDPAGTVLDCRVETNFFRVMQMGLARTLERAWSDANALTTLTPSSASSRGMSGSGTSDITVPDGASGIQMAIRALTDAERKAKTQYYFEHLKRQAVKIFLRIRGRSDLALFDQIEFVYSRPDGTSHYLSGLYTIRAVSHDIGDEGWVTDLEADRLSLGEGDPAIVAAQEQVVRARARADALQADNSAFLKDLLQQAHAQSQGSARSTALSIPVVRDKP